MMNSDLRLVDNENEITPHWRLILHKILSLPY